MEGINVLADFASHWAGKTPDKVAMIAGDRQWTFSEIEGESMQVAHGLRAAGIGPGDRVAFLDRNVPEYFPLLFGGAKLNAVSVAVNWRLAPPEMEFIINNSEAKALFVGAEFLSHLTKMNLTTTKLVVVIDEHVQGEATDETTTETSGAEHPKYAQWVAQNPAEPLADPPEIGPEDTCYQLYTSGTTGLPKGVEITNRNFTWTMRIGVEGWQLHQNAVNLVAMPLFHIAGSGWGLAGMFSGAQTVIAREVDPAEIVELIQKHSITHALLVPAVLQFILAVPAAAEADFSSMEAVVYGASPITEQVLVGSMEMFKCDFVQAYGLTETTGGVAQLDPIDHDPAGGKAHLLRAAGKPWGDVELRIVDTASLKDVAEGEVGEVWVRSAQVMKGYWKNPEATAAAISEDGWFRTGDAGYMNDGYLFIHDRVKDMIISGGENIYPAEIENALMKHPAIADVAVIGVPDEKWGESVKAIIVKAGGDLTEADLHSYARENLASYKCPKSVDWVDALPRNPSGKILKTELRAPYWEGKERSVN